MKYTFFQTTDRLWYTDIGFSFKGRACRSELWWTVLYSIYPVGCFALSIFLANILDFSSILSFFMYIVVFAFFIKTLMMYIIVLASFVRRFHDLNLPGFIPVVVYVMQLLVNIVYSYDSSYISKEFDLAVTIACLLVMLISCIKGTDGYNKYGADPLDE